MDGDDLEFPRQGTSAGSNGGANAFRIACEQACSSLGDLQLRHIGPNTALMNAVTFRQHCFGCFFAASRKQSLSDGSLVCLKAPLLTLSQPGFSCAPKTNGREHSAPSPLVKTLLTFSDSIQVKFSESFTKNESLDATLVSMETMGSVLRWFKAIRFLTGNPYSKIKNPVPLVESQEK